MTPIEDSDEALLEGELIEATPTRRAAVAQRAQSLAPVAKAAAVATVGAAAGAVTAVVVSRVSQQPQRSLGRRRKADPVYELESTTRFIIDIHRLAQR